MLREWQAPDSSEAVPGPPVLPPPPELPALGRERVSLTWRTDPGRPRMVPRHPLLCACVVEEVIDRGGDRGPELPLLGRISWPRRSPRADPATGTREKLLRPSPLKAGRPLVTVVAGGKGGSGRSTLALGIAWAAARQLAATPFRVLLVDADPEAPDLDLLLGAMDPLGGSDPVESRVDRVMVRLPELADGRLRLESLLWRDPRTGCQALLAPVADGDGPLVGREHLDYLYQYFLSPGFDAIVVDLGAASDLRLGGSSQAHTEFWLAHADAVLVPLRAQPAHVRAAKDALRVIQATGAQPGAFRLVMAVEGSAEGLGRSLDRELEGLPVVRVPWSPSAARRAELEHTSIADFDRATREALLQLTLDLAALGSSGTEWR